MSLLEKGIILLDGFELSPDTKLEEFERAFSESIIKTEMNGITIYNFGTRVFNIYEQSFFVRTVQFSKTGRLSHIELTCVKTVPRTAYFSQQNLEFTEAIAGDWLQASLGLPQHAESHPDKIMSYDFVWGSLGYYCMFDRHDMCYYGNKIEIDYRRYSSKVNIDSSTMTAHVFEEVEE